jgi:hypothetical protein
MKKELYCNTCKKITMHTWTSTFTAGRKKVRLWDCENRKHGQAEEICVFQLALSSPSANLKKWRRQEVARA